MEFIAQNNICIFFNCLCHFLWAFFAAPKSVHRLKMPYLAIFRASIFLIASFLLYQTEQKNIAIAFALLAIVTQAVSFFAEE